VIADLLQGYLDQQAESRPDAVAFVQGRQTITYAELMDSSNRLAQLLLTAGCGHRDRVCLLMDRSINAVVAMLGALKAGCAYVPIDPTAPASRSAHIVATVQPAAIVADPAAVTKLDELRRLAAVARETPLISLEDPVEALPSDWVTLGVRDLTQHDPAAPPPAGSGDDAAYIMFTSGSTGTPKGAVVTHANVRAFTDWAVDHFDVHVGDRHSWQPPLHFDLTTWDVYGGLSGGAEVHIVPPGTLMPQQIFDFITTHRLTQWFSVPSAMAYASRSRRQSETLNDLRRVQWCGEVMPTAVLRDWMQRAPQAQFTNLYGPTETTVASSYFTIPAVPAPDDPPAPIGRACEGEELLVLDQAMRPAAIDQIGEIYIGGAGVGAGYWGDDAGTRAVFVADPRLPESGAVIYRTGDLGRVGADGDARFVGRADTQIKSRGYRIELGEIEVALARLPEIAESAVLALDLGGFEGTTIGCAVAQTAGSHLEFSDIRERLAEFLPSYMIPTRWRIGDELPKNGNGKIDRQRLTVEMMEDH
jgi:amino acid adenylation domain-containing protein